MANKKKIRLATERFISQSDEILNYVKESESYLGDKNTSWSYEYAVIRLYREFEKLMLEAIVGTINNDTQTVSDELGIKLPKHLTDEVCEYLVTGSGYFDFKGRDGLIHLLSKYLPNENKKNTKATKPGILKKTHYLIEIVKSKEYTSAIDQLSALRNFAAHGSTTAKKSALKAVKQERMGSSGAWLKRQNRFETMANKLKKLATEIKEAAPR